MKNKIQYIFIILLLFLFTGCSKGNYLSNNDFIINENVTSKNITINDSKDDFIRAYSNIDNDINVRYSNGDNHLIEENIRSIDFSQNCTVYISGISIDGTCVPVNKFIQSEKITIGLDDWFNQNKDYLNKHDAIYKALSFTFENSVITNIRYIEKNYNDI